MAPVASVWRALGVSKSDDVGNGRFQEFDRTGTLRRVFNSPVPVRHFAIESDGTVLVALADRAWYLARVFEDGRWEPFAKRPAPTSTANARGDHLVATPGDGAGHLLLLFSAGTTVGLWMDIPRSRTVLLTTDAANTDEPFWSASVGDVDGDTLVIVSHAGQVYRRRVSR